jgi:hypothetical protein
LEKGLKFVSTTQLYNPEATVIPGDHNRILSPLMVYSWIKQKLRHEAVISDYGHGSMVDSLFCTEDGSIRLITYQTTCSSHFGIQQISHDLNVPMAKISTGRRLHK